MRIYVMILLGAIALLAAITILSNLAFPGFLTGAEFRKAMIAESISFICTTAVIGSLSAAVLRYLDGRKVKPILEYGSKRIDAHLFEAIHPLIVLSLYGQAKPAADYSEQIVRGDRLLPRYTPINDGLLTGRLSQGLEHSRLAIRELERFSAHFEIEFQDDISRLVDSMGMLEAFYASLSAVLVPDSAPTSATLLTDQAETKLDWAAIHTDIHNCFAPHVPDGEPSSSGLIQANRAPLSAYVRNAIAAVAYTHSCQAEVRTVRSGGAPERFSRIVQLCNMLNIDFDLSEPITDEEARIVARLDTFDIDWEGDTIPLDIALYHLDQTGDARGCIEDQLYPWGRERYAATVQTHDAGQTQVQAFFGSIGQMGAAYRSSSSPPVDL